MHRRNYKGGKFGRTKGPRKALLRNLATSIVLHEKVRTTKSKAKEIQPIVEKLITLAKKGDLAATRKLHSYLLDEQAVIKIKHELAPIYKKRNGGYTRVINLGTRVGDGAPEAMIELLDTDKILKKDKSKKGEEKPARADGSSRPGKEEKPTSPKASKDKGKK